jgi:predicted nucleotidyltransferase
MEAPSYFIDFLQAIRPTEEQRQVLRDGHIELRERLDDYELLKPAIVTTFLQGSYRRSTALKPAPKRRSDVDIIVVTKLHEDEYTPGEALDLFQPFVEKYYKGEYRIQGRSIGISKKRVDLDLVITSSPPEQVMGILPEEGESDEPLEEESPVRQLKEAVRSAAWKDAPLRIPDREAKQWEVTHPLAQLEWTREKNAATSGHFVNVVKAIKWWKYSQHPDSEQPRGYPLERIIAECCPDGVCSVAEGVAKTLEEIAERFAGGKPVMPDHGCHPDVFQRITPQEFHEFHGLVARAAKLARRALDAEPLEESVKLWRELFGDEFPEPPDDDNGGKKGGFTPRKEPTVPGSGRFA